MLNVQNAVSMQLQRALHNPSLGISVLSNETIGHLKKKKKKIFTFIYKCSFCTSSAMCICNFTYYVVMLERSCVT